MTEAVAVVTEIVEASMFWHWYPRGNAAVLGIWPSTEAANVGDGRWREDIPGWILPQSPPRMEMVFPLPECAQALEILLERDNYPGLRAVLISELGMGYGGLLHDYPWD